MSYPVISLTYPLLRASEENLGKERLRVLITFNLTSSTTFTSKYFPTYSVFKLSGQNISKNGLKKLKT
jgi:hypothetical protein